MPDNTVENGQLTNSTKDEEKAFPAGARAHSIIIKALKTNVGNVWIGKQEAAKSSNGGFPLAPGEFVAIDLKNTQSLRYSFDTANDKLAWLVTSP